MMGYVGNVQYLCIIIVFNYVITIIPTIYNLIKLHIHQLISSKKYFLKLPKMITIAYNVKQVLKIAYFHILNMAKFG